MTSLSEMAAKIESKPRAEKQSASEIAAHFKAKVAKSNVGPDGKLIPKSNIPSTPRSKAEVREEAEKAVAAHKAAGKTVTTVKESKMSKSATAKKAPVAKKPATPKKPGRLESDSETVRKIVKLASRPQGATKAELEEASGWKNAGWPWMFYNKNTGKGIAPRHGMKLVIEKGKPGKGDEPRTYTHYKLVPDKSAKAA